MAQFFFSRIRRAPFVGLIALGLLAGCGEKNAYVPPPPPKVAVAPPVKKPVQRYLEATGNTAAVNTANLVARVPGFIQAIGYKDGADVKKGDVLFTIEPEPYDLKLKQSQAAEAAAQANLVKTDADYARQADLVARGSAAQVNLDTATANRDSARASLQEAQVNTKLAAINVDYAHVAAPFAGKITARLVSIGDYVGGNGAATVLATAVQLDPIYVNFSISEQDVLRVRALIQARGLTDADLSKVPVEVGLQTETGFPHRGTLDYRAPTVDPSTGTMAGRAIFDNARSVLVPGYFVRVRIPLGAPQDALLVPDVALGTDQSGRYLYVVNKENVVEQRKVEIGPLDGTFQVIEKGLEPDDRVIVNGMLRAVPGQKVDPQAAAAPAGK